MPLPLLLVKPAPRSGVGLVGLVPLLKASIGEIYIRHVSYTTSIVVERTHLAQLSRTHRTRLIHDLRSTRQTQAQPKSCRRRRSSDRRTPPRRRPFPFLAFSGYRRRRRRNAHIHRIGRRRQRSRPTRTPSRLSLARSISTPRPVPLSLPTKPAPLSPHHSRRRGKRYITPSTTRLTFENMRCA